VTSSAIKKKKFMPRSVALAVLLKVIRQGQSLSGLKQDFQVLDDIRDRALATEIVNGVLRWRWKLDAILSQQLKKSIRNKDIDIRLILLIAIYELTELGIPDYATVNEAVALVKSTKKIWAKSLVNAVLRNVIRQADESDRMLEKDESAFYSHPPWLLDVIKNDWPERWRDIVDANNQRPPVWLRINLRQNTASDYQEKLGLQSIDFSLHPVITEAIKIESKVAITELPGFEDGEVSVQDAGAQFAAHLLGAKEGERVLDLCAAPGGKTCHILELCPGLEQLVAVDNVELRMLRLAENLARLKLDATLITGDATDVKSWWDGSLFDRILVDAPCSATGVIRRHPDIKSLRREDDLDALVAIQQNILSQAWAMLSPGGRLLYVTCSVLKQENEGQIRRFMRSHDDAVEEGLVLGSAMKCEPGRQLLPGDMDMDGFYYACLSKQE